MLNLYTFSRRRMAKVTLTYVPERENLKCWRYLTYERAGGFQAPNGLITIGCSKLSDAVTDAKRAARTEYNAH